MAFRSITSDCTSFPKDIHLHPLDDVCNPLGFYRLPLGLAANPLDIRSKSLGFATVSKGLACIPLASLSISLEFISFPKGVLSTSMSYVNNSWMLDRESSAFPKQHSLFQKILSLSSHIQIQNST